MFHLCEVAVLVLASLWLVQGEPGIVRQGDYVALRNTSTGSIVCAVDEPHTVRNDTRSHLHCSTTCLQNDQCSSFNYKDIGCGFTCEHFKGYPFKFTVDPNCRHYAVSACRCFHFGYFFWNQVGGFPWRLCIGFLDLKLSRKYCPLSGMQGFWDNCYRLHLQLDP